MRKNITNSQFNLDLSTIGNVRVTPPTIDNNIVIFDGITGNIKDSNVPIGDLIFSQSPVVNDNIVIYDGTTGNIKDSNVPIGDLIFSQSPVVNDNIVVYDGTTGNIQDSGTSITVLDALPTFDSYSATTTFNSDPAGLNPSLFIRAVKVGSVVTVTVQNYRGAMTTKASFTAATPLSAAFRPAAFVYVPFLTFEDSGANSDIVGTLEISTSGHIKIHKEISPGSNTFDGSNVGWSYLSASYYV